MTSGYINSCLLPLFFLFLIREKLLLKEQILSYKSSPYRKVLVNHKVTEVVPCLTLLHSKWAKLGLNSMEFLPF